MVDLGMTDGSMNLTGAESRSWRGFADTRLYDCLLRLPVALWFLTLGAIFVGDTVAAVDDIRASGLDAFSVAQLVSRICLFSFFTLIAWLTLVRARPLAQAAGLQPRVSALLGCYLVCGFGFLPANPHLGAGLPI